MGLFEHFPYTNFHELNADWLLRKTKELLQRMTAAEARLDAAEARLDAAEGRLDVLEADVAAIKAQIIVINQQITSLTNRVSDLESRMTQAEADIDDLEERMTQAETDIEALEARVTQTETDISALEIRMTQAEADIDALEARVETVWYNINETDVDTFNEACQRALDPHYNVLFRLDEGITLNNYRLRQARYSPTNQRLNQVYVELDYMDGDQTAPQIKHTSYLGKLNTSVDPVVTVWTKTEWTTSL